MGAADDPMTVIDPATMEVHGVEGFGWRTKRPVLITGCSSGIGRLTKASVDTMRTVFEVNVSGLGSADADTSRSGANARRAGKKVVNVRFGLTVVTKRGVLVRAVQRFCAESLGGD